MHPIFLQIGPLTIRWYGVCVALGFLAAFWLFRRRARPLGLGDDATTNLMLLLFGAGLVGARVWYVARYWREEFAGNFREIFMVQHGGLVFLGGFFAAMATLWAWCRVKKLPLAPLADALAPGLALGQALGRLGCFMNGCCYGRPTDAPWAIAPNAPSLAAGIPRHPTQLYEAIGLFDLAAALLFMRRVQRYPGQIAWSYALLYALLRFFVEFFRGDVPHDAFGRFTSAQVACVLLFAVAWAGSSRAAYRAAKARRAASRAAMRMTGKSVP
ncbi:MAG: prolipoprotein diacylglyceryl transferase [Verrucomicrobiae bacterium]|nr:prolipoprotein diacylglyceryl transferase [Verrucomicrobiae bacterium]